LATLYDQRLRQEDWIQCPPRREQAKDTYYAYALRCSQRDALQAHLAERGIEAPIHFPTPIHTQTAYLERFGSPVGAFGNTETLAASTLSLPCHPLLRDQDVERVCDAVVEFGKAL